MEYHKKKKGWIERSQKHFDKTNLRINEQAQPGASKIEEVDVEVEITLTTTWKQRYYACLLGELHFLTILKKQWFDVKLKEGKHDAENKIIFKWKYIQKEVAKPFFSYVYPITIIVSDPWMF